MKIYPFHEGDTFATFRNIIQKSTQEIDSLDNDYLLKASATELEKYFLDKVMIKPLILHSDQYYIEDQRGTKRRRLWETTLGTLLIKLTY